MQVKSNTHKILTTSLVLGYLYLLMTTTFYGYSNYFNLPLSDSLFSPQVPFLEARGNPTQRVIVALLICQGAG